MDATQLKAYRDKLRATENNIAIMVLLLTRAPCLLNGMMLII